MIYLKLFLSFLQIGLFSFGGGYAAMPLIQEQVVSQHDWLTMTEFTDSVSYTHLDGYKRQAVTGAFDVTALNNIPDGDMVAEQHGRFLFNCLRSFLLTKFRQQFPESILFMSVVEIIFP